MLTTALRQFKTKIMSVLNKKICVGGGANTGYGDCYLDPKAVAMVILAPAGFRFTEANLASTPAFLAALEAAINADNPANRLYPTPPVEGITDNSEATVFATLGYGAQYPVRDGYYNIQFQFLKGGMCALKQLQKFNGSNWDAFLIDQAGTLIGRKDGKELAPAKLSFFFAPKFNLSDGTNPAGYFFALSMKPDSINQNIGFVSLDSGYVDDLMGLQNVVLELSVPRAAGVIRFKATTGCSGLDMYDQYSVQLADADNFIVRNASGTLVPITSVAANIATKDFTLTLDTTSPAYTLAGDYTVYGAAVSVLTGNGIEGFEIIPLFVD